MRIVRIQDVGDERVAAYSRLTEAQLRNRLDSASGRMIVESPKVIKVALQAGYEPLSMLCEERHIAGDAAEIISMCPSDLPLYTASRETLASLTGYSLTRGVLCEMRRPGELPLSELLEGARRVCVLSGVCDTTNIGAIFRSAAALGIDAVLLTRDSCDPLNRRAIRVSMGTVFLVKWGWIDNINDLKQYGFKTVAMALRNNSIDLDDRRLKQEPRLATVMGTEGDGLSAEAIDDADYVVKIPMSHGVDSLNVAAASAVAFWELCRREG